MNLLRRVEKLWAAARNIRPASAGFGWLVGALLLASLAQVFLMRELAAPGLLLYGTAGGVFALLAQRAGWHMPSISFLARGKVTLRGWLLSALAVGLVALSCYWVWQPVATPDQQRAMLAFWLGGAVLFSAGVLRASNWRMPGWRALVAGQRTGRGEWALWAGLVGLALLLRMFDLEVHPYAFANDEGWIGVEAGRILSGEVTNLFRTGWSAQPNLSFVPAALSIALLGKTVTAVRLVSAVQGVLTTIFTCLAGREAFGRRAGWMAAFVLAAMPAHVHFSRTGFNNILPGFYATLLVWLTLRALRRGEVSAYLWAGLATGSALYTYLGSRLAMLLAVGVLGFAVLTRRGYLRAHLAHLAVFVLAMLLVAAPMAVYFLQDVNIFMARVNAESIFQSGWLAREMAGGRSLPDIMLEQLARSTLVFVSIGGRAAFFNTPQPYLPAAAALFGMLGMAYSLSRLKRLEMVTLQAWFWSVILTAGVLTSGPPQHQRMVMALPAAALLVGLGLEQTAWIGARLRLGTPRMWQGFSALVVAGTVLHGVGFYFGEYYQKSYYNDRGNEVTEESIRLMRQMHPHYRMVSLMAPLVHLEFANFRYLAGDYARQEFPTASGLQVAEAVGASTPAVYFSIPERRADLEQVAAALPGGQWLEVKRMAQPGQVLFFAYLNPPADQPLLLPEKRSGQLITPLLLWILVALLIAAALEAVFLPLLWRITLRKPVPASNWAHLKGAMRAWWHAPPTELAAAPTPDLELRLLSRLRRALTALQSPATQADAVAGASPAHRAIDTPLPLQQVDCDVSLAPGEIVQVDVHSGTAEIHHYRKKRSVF